MSQPLPFREQTKALEHLQELDLKIDSLQKRKAALPVSLKAAEDALAKVSALLQVKENAITEIEKTKRQTQAALDLNNDRLARAKGKLEGVHNSQEFQAANKEIDQLQKMNTGLEEQMKKFDADVVAIKKDSEALVAQVEKAKSERDAIAAQVGTEGGKLETDISALTGERKQFTDQVDKRILSQYDRIRTARAGLGFVVTVAGRCMGCNMMLPPQLYNEIQKGTGPHNCPSCHRILSIPSSQQK
ncbi:hypothetical protein K2X30_07885 [bacterium]|nr:hypothetical protein [bacterium]